MATTISGVPHLELKTAFGIDKLLSPKTAREIFDECNEKLKQPEYSARGLMKHYNVECVCTTDDPVDDLHNHIEYAKHKAADDPIMIPAWRPDKAMNIEKPEFADYVHQLENVSGVTITKFADMVDALQKRHDFFAAQGSKLSDHGIEEFYDEDYTDSQIETIFEKAMRGQQLSNLEIRQYKNCFLTRMAEMDAEAGWTQQFHYGAIRDNNTAMYNKLGPDTGFDSIGEFNTAKAMSKFLNKLNMEGKLTRTILYTLNPCANEVIATMLGNFQGGEPGKIQFGSGWWFNDQMDGMIRQMNALSVSTSVASSATCWATMWRRACCPTIASCWARWWKTSRTTTQRTISSSINKKSWLTRIELANFFVLLHPKNERGITNIVCVE